MLEIKTCRPKVKFECCFVTEENWEEFVRMKNNNYKLGKILNVQYSKVKGDFTLIHVEIEVKDTNLLAKIYDDIHIDSWYVESDGIWKCGFIDYFGRCYELIEGGDNNDI